MVSEKWYLTIVLICISLVMNKVEYIFSCLSLFFKSFCKLFGSFPCLFFSLLSIFERALDTLSVLQRDRQRQLFVVYVVNIFSEFFNSVFIWFMVFSACKYFLFVCSQMYQTFSFIASGFCIRGPPYTIVNNKSTSLFFHSLCGLIFYFLIYLDFILVYRVMLLFSH